MFKRCRTVFTLFIAMVAVHLQGAAQTISDTSVVTSQQGPFENIPPDFLIRDERVEAQSVLVSNTQPNAGEYYQDTAPQANQFDPAIGEEAQANHLPPYELYQPNGKVPQYNWNQFLRLNTPLTAKMLDFQNRQTDKQIYLLCDQPQDCVYPTVSLGAQFRASFLTASTTGNSQFPYLGRFPTDFTGTSATDARLVHANFAGAAHFSNWAHGFTDLLFSDVFTFPSFEQGSFQVRQAYVALGNLNCSPFYAFIGKKNVSFGDMGTLSPFSQSTVWHYFGSLAEGIGFGYQQKGFHAVVTGLNGGRGIRVVDSHEIGKINNFAVNGAFCRHLNHCSYFQVGAGFLRGTIYDAAVPEHIDPTITGPQNPAWDINTLLKLGRLRLAGEVASTVETWPVTNHRVTAYRTEASWDTCVRGNPAALSMSWSEGIQGPSGSQFEYNQQFVLGLGVYPSDNTMMSVEYVQSLGFAPLIDITNVSDRSVRQHSIVFGLVLVL